MSAADLLPLALAAIEDTDARLVLADALEESGWWDHRLRYGLSSGDDREQWIAMLSWPGALGGEHAMGIAAVLLFGGWSTEMWPAARRCPRAKNVVRDMSTPENRAFWGDVERAAAEVATWPAWERALF